MVIEWEIKAHIQTLRFDNAYKVYCNVRSKIRIIREDISKTHSIELQKPHWVTSARTRSKMLRVSTKCSLQEPKNLYHDNLSMEAN